MCFSATGSFAISGVLSALGALSLARGSSTPRQMFAGIPLLFAVQQAAEGTVWLTLEGNHPALNRIAVSVFLGIAFVVWPIWLPLALARVERTAGKRPVLRAFFWSGCFVAVCATVLLARLHPVPRIAGHSIAYEFAGSTHVPTLLLYLAAYVIPTILPFFVSTFGLARWIGTMLVASLVVSAIVQRGALTSVWCFFAALLSGLIVIAVARDPRPFNRLRSPAV